MPAPKITKAAIQRAIEATKAAGLTPSAVTVSKDGTVRIETAPVLTLDTVPASAQVLTLDTAPESAQVLKPKQWATR